MIGVCHSIVEIMQLKGEKMMDILQTRQQRNIYNIYFVHLIKKYSFSNKYSTIINKQFQFMQYTSLVNT